MVLHLAGRGGVSVSPELRRRIEAKIAKMQRLFPKLIEARVVLATERYRHLAEVTLRAKRATFHVEDEAPDFHAAVDQALTTLSAQIRRKKERVTAKKPRPSRTRPASRRGTGSPPEPVDEAPSEPPPVVVRRTNAKPMSLEEAVDQLRLQTDGLLVFRNARTRTVNVLRRRPDGTVELVEPAG
jgi:ribosome hibernation promoting factor